ncbi:hypothetical protein EGT07_13245 [Herbaspirillum sp. HC18]|nr:hypothetical protein EGT07_13245 [Herbaspirillum sp. HC18]
MSEVVKIRHLHFSDLYLGYPGMEERFSTAPGSDTRPIPDNPALRDDIGQLTAICRDTFCVSPSVMDFKVFHDGVAYRVSAIPSQRNVVFVLRKLAKAVPALAELGIPNLYMRNLMASDLSGLLVISGPQKAGKTTTAAALVKERLKAFGGVAVTGEKLIELPLEGGYSKGICFQSLMPHDRREFPEAFRRLLRAGARTILIDEISDPYTATEVLKASVNGELIITTMVADNVIQTISKLHACCHHELAPGGAQSLIAEGLAGVLTQRVAPGIGFKLVTESLFFKDAPVAKSVLRSGKYEMLASDIRQQVSNMLTECAVAQRDDF